MGSHSTNEQDEALDRERALSAGQVGDLIGLSTVTLEQMRRRGEGPRFFRVNARNVRYRLGDVLDWRDARTVGKRSAP